jgi:hypothetical protein
MTTFTISSFSTEIQPNFSLNASPKTELYQSHLAKRVFTVAMLTLTTAAAATFTALSLGLDIPVVMVLSAAAGSAALLFTALMQKAYRPLPKAPLVSVFSQEVQQLAQAQFVDANQTKLDHIANAFQVHGSQSKLNDADLDKILEVIDEVKGAAWHAERYQKLLSQLVEQFGLSKTQEVLNHAHVFPRSIHDPKCPLSNRAIEILIKRAENYFYNQDLKARFYAEAENLGCSVTLVDEVLKQLKTDEFFNGSHQISLEREAAILTCLRQAAARQQFGHLLQNIKEGLKQDLYLSEDAIDSKFKVTETIKTLPIAEQQERRAMLQKIINQAYVNQELRQKGKLASGTEEESLLLSHLGYDISDQSPYYDKQRIFEVINQSIQLQLQGEGFKGPLSFVRQSLKECALNARLQTLQIDTTEQVQKFKLGLEKMQIFRTELTVLHADIGIQFPTDFPLKSPSIGLKMMEQTFNQLKSGVVEQKVKEYLSSKKVREYFINAQVDPVHFELYLQERKKNFKTDKFIERCEESRTYLEKDVNFYATWGSYLKAEMIQGFTNEHEILNGGVCFGVSNKVQMLTQKNPDWTGSEIAPHINLMSKDRYFQTLHEFGSRKTGARLPSQVIEKEGFKKDIELFNLIYDAQEQNLEKMLTAKDDQLASSQGLLRLHLHMENGGHAILLRLDKQRNRAWVLDPNMGLLCFEKEGAPFAEAQLICIEFLKGLIQHHYPLTYKIAAHQIS